MLFFPLQCAPAAGVGVLAFGFDGSCNGTCSNVDKGVKYKPPLVPVERVFAIVDILLLIHEIQF